MACPVEGSKGTASTGGHVERQDGIIRSRMDQCAPEGDRTAGRAVNGDGHKWPPPALRRWSERGWRRALKHLLEVGGSEESRELRGAEMHIGGLHLNVLQDHVA